MPGSPVRKYTTVKKRKSLSYIYVSLAWSWSEKITPHFFMAGVVSRDPMALQDRNAKISLSLSFYLS